MEREKAGGGGQRDIGGDLVMKRSLNCNRCGSESRRRFFKNDSNRFGSGRANGLQSSGNTAFLLRM